MNRQITDAQAALDLLREKVDEAFDQMLLTHSAKAQIDDLIEEVEAEVIAYTDEVKS